MQRISTSTPGIISTYITPTMDKYIRRSQREAQLSQRAIDNLPDESLESATSVPSTPTPSAPPPVPTPFGSESRATTPSSHSSVFPLRLDAIWYEGKCLTGVKYRPRHSRIINTNARISWIYEHGADIEADGENNKKLWLCKDCHISRRPGQSVFKATSSSSAANHLNRKHSIFEVDVEESHSSTANSEQSVIPFADNQYKQDLIDWIIAHDLPLNLPTHDDSRKLLSQGKPEILHILPKSHTTMSTWVKQSYLDRAPKIKKILDTAKSRINLSMDAWKASNKQDYLGIAAHLIDSQLQVRHILLDFLPISGKKSGANLAQLVYQTVGEYDIGKRLGAVMADNAGDNDTCMQELGKLLGFPDEWAKIARVRCLGHIIDLVVKAVLFGKGVSKLQRELAGASPMEVLEIWTRKGPIGKLHNWAVYLNRNKARMDVFLSYQQELNGDGFVVYSLLADGGIRWGAVFVMIERGEYERSLYKLSTNCSSTPSKCDRPLPAEI